MEVKWKDLARRRIKIPSILRWERKSRWIKSLWRNAKLFIKSHLVPRWSARTAFVGIIHMKPREHRTSNLLLLFPLSHLPQNITKSSANSSKDASFSQPMWKNLANFNYPITKNRLNPNPIPQQKRSKLDLQFPTTNHEQGIQQIIRLTTTKNPILVQNFKWVSRIRPPEGSQDPKIQSLHQKTPVFRGEFAKERFLPTNSAVPQSTALKRLKGNCEKTRMGIESQTSWSERRRQKSDL